MDLSKLDPQSLVAGTNSMHDAALSTLGRLGQYGSSSSGGLPPLQGGMGSGPNVTDPYGDAMSVFSRMTQNNANTYNPATGTAKTYNASTYNPATGTASLVGDTPQVQAASLLDNLGAYMSPYTNDVVNTTLQGYDQGAGYSRAGDALARAGDTTFGGSGGAIQTALNEQNIRQNRSQLEAGLRDQAFNTGANLSNLDAGRRQSASSENAASALQRALANQSAQNTYGLANMDALNQAGQFNANSLNQAGQFNAGAENTFGLANMGALNDAGRYNAAQRDTDLARQLSGAAGLVSTAGAQDANTRENAQAQSQLAEILRQIEAAQRAAGVNLLGTQAGLFGGLPISLLHGQNSTGNVNTNSNSTQTVSDPMGTLSGILQGAGSLASGLGALGSAGGFASVFSSDVRLKTDIRKVGERADGLGVYEFRYRGRPQRFRGVMAHEVRQVKPEAVVTMPDGYDGVDYAKLGDA